jgi:hypothetical protein
MADETTARVLCTFPGRHGDLLWALPTIRSIAEEAGDPVDLLIAGEFAGLIPLLARQAYLHTVDADATWNPQDRVPIVPPGYDHVYHLGYPRWPELPLPFETYNTAVAAGIAIPPLDLTRPWIQITSTPSYNRAVVFGWTDCHFELKYGLTELLFPDTDESWRDQVASAPRSQVDVNVLGLFPPGSRWITEGHYVPSTWLEAARWLTRAKVVLTDCSALHVLAVALGIPVVLVEPMEARWNPIFYPCGDAGPQVTVVKGLDGKPTVDARHVTDTLSRVLHGR